MNKTENWIKYYIENINLENIEWIKLNSDELKKFIEDNYFDIKKQEYVLDQSADNLSPRFLGMHYLNLYSLNSPKECNFLLGVINNNIDKKTIVCSIIYFDEYFMFSNQNEPVTYVSTVEVNEFFRNQGIYRKMCNIFFDFIKSNQHIVISQQSVIGKKCGVYEILNQTAIKKRFEKCVLEENDNLFESKIYKMGCSKTKILRHIKKYVGNI